MNDPAEPRIKERPRHCHTTDMSLIANDDVFLLIMRTWSSGEDSLWHLHIVLSRVSARARVLAQQHLADAAWHVPFLAQARVFWLRASDLRGERDHAALLLGMRTFRSHADAQFSAVTQLTSFLVYGDGLAAGGAWRPQNSEAVAMLDNGAMATITSTMRAHPRAGVLDCILQPLCVLLLAALIHPPVSVADVRTLAERGRFAAHAHAAGVFGLLPPAMLTHLEDDRLQQGGIRILHACAVGPAAAEALAVLRRVVAQMRHGPIQDQGQELVDDLCARLR